MTTTAANIRDVLILMDKRLAAAKAELATTDLAVDPEFYLMGGRNDMVVVKSTDNLFRLDAASHDKGYAFETFTKAKAAALRWNSALTPVQKAARCNVTPVSRKQYLEHIVTNLEELRPNMVQLGARLAEEEAKR